MAPFMWAIRDDSRITGTTFSVAAMHAAIADVATGGNIYASHQTMAEKLGLRSRKTVGEHQKRLRDLGYLQTTAENGRARTHRLSLPVQR